LTDHKYFHHSTFYLCILAITCYGHPVYIADVDIIFSSCGFFFFFSRLFSAAADWMSSILPHMMWP